MYHSVKAIMFWKTLIGFKVSYGAAVAFYERWQYLLAECYLKSECSVDSKISYPDITVIDNAEFLWNQFHFFLWSQATFMSSDWRRSKMLFVECQTECYLILFIVIRQHCHKTAAVDTSCPWGSPSGVLPDRISKGATPSTLHLKGLTPFSINQQSVWQFSKASIVNT